MDFTTFDYITVIPDVITQADWYTLAIRSYNLGLTLFWFIIGMWLLDTIFKMFAKMHSKGRE